MPPVETFAFYLLLFLGGVLLLALGVRAWRRRGTLPGEVSRLPRTPRAPLALLALLLLALQPACGAPLNAARRDFAAALKVAEAAQSRLKASDARHQLDLVRAAPDREKGAATLAAYRKRRAAVLEQAAHTESVMDASADVLLIGEGPAPARAAADARASALALREAVTALMEGK